MTCGNTIDLEVRQTELRKIISSLPGDKWDDKVDCLARIEGKHKGTVYKWLSNAPPVNKVYLLGLQKLSEGVLNEL